jgi:hypothetical protein
MRCPYCGGGVSFIQAYGRYYCYRCRKYVIPKVQRKSGKKFIFILIPVIVILAIFLIFQFMGGFPSPRPRLEVPEVELVELNCTTSEVKLSVKNLGPIEIPSGDAMLRILTLEEEPLQVEKLRISPVPINSTIEFNLTTSLEGGKEYLVTILLPKGAEAQGSCSP